MTLEAKIESLEKKIDSLVEFFIISKRSFPTKKSVANHFSVSERTIDNWRENGKFEIGVEYIIKDDGRIEYLTNGILKHQEKICSTSQKRDTNKTENKNFYNPIAENMIKSLSCLK